MDIRRGGVPVLRSNLICFGYSDGVVVGDEGRGLIEGNTIYGEERVPGSGPQQPTWEAESPAFSASLGVLRRQSVPPGLKDILCRTDMVSGLLAGGLL